MTSAIGTLWSYSFINKRSDGKTYDMHRLVHVAARVWIQQKGLAMETQRKAMEHLSKAFPWNKWDNRELWREYIPHAARMRDAKDGGDADARWMLCFKAGRCLRLDGRIRDAVCWLEDSLDLRAHLPEDDENRLSTQHALATAYEANGQVKDAIQLLEHVVAIEGRVLAEDHPDRLASQHELARAYSSNGQVKDAVQLLEHVVAIQRRVLAEDHPDRLASQHELAGAYSSNGQVKDAVQLLEHVVAIEKRVLAEDHPERLVSQHELARAYLSDDQGRVKEAVQLLEQVVAIQKRTLAEDHPKRLRSERLLARAYDKLESQPPSQTNEQEAGPSSATRSTAEPEQALPRLSRKHPSTRPLHDRPSRRAGPPSARTSTA
jgi:tetratricopeptide (TPR) repeat protein